MNTRSQAAQIIDKIEDIYNSEELSPAVKEVLDETAKFMAYYFYDSVANIAPIDDYIAYDDDNNDDMLYEPEDLSINTPIAINEASSKSRDSIRKTIPQTKPELTKEDEELPVEPIRKPREKKSKSNVSVDTVIRYPNRNISEKYAAFKN